MFPIRRAHEPEFGPLNVVDLIEVITNGKLGLEGSVAFVGVLLLR